MQGFHVRRKAGWDTHGLPVELQVEKELGITKDDIGKKMIEMQMAYLRSLGKLPAQELPSGDSIV